MKRIIPFATYFGMYFLTSFSTFGQCSGWSNLQLLDSLFTNPFFGITTSLEADKLNRPFDYLANVSGGIKIYDNISFGSPTLVSTIPKTLLGSLDVINLYQDSIWLYASLGNIWDTTELAGLAIIDVSNPIVPNVLSVYIYPGLKGGSGAVVVRGDYAYLAANQNGLVILDIRDKRKIQFKSRLLLDNIFPHSKVASTLLYNARGIELKEQFAYVCYDRGGLRVIDISNVNAPFQINQYCFSALIDKATAYNNVVIHNNLAFVSIDYYGMEILDITNPKNISQLGWWHPNSWADATNDFSTWSNAEGHANELAYDTECSIIYLAGGKSDLVAIDVSNTTTPTTCQTYGSTKDDYGTWGLDFYNKQVHIGYIWSPITPPHSNYTGYKLLQTQCKTTNQKGPNLDIEVSISPNPTLGMIHVNTNGQELRSVKIFNLNGECKQVESSMYFSLASLPAGFYYLHIETDKLIRIVKAIKQ